MDGIHDLGGRQGFGPIEREVDEPVFHERWEAAVFTMTRAARAAGARKNTDQFRYAVERIDPVAYLTHGYYGRWLGALETLLVEAGTVATEAVNRRVTELGGDPGKGRAARPQPGRRQPAPPTADGARRPLETPPAFAVGERIRTSMRSNPEHTRLPTYARGRRGTVVSLHGGWVFPDTNAIGVGECPQHLYTVAFMGTELWGESAEPGITVCLDLFEPYLERCE